MAHNLNQQFRNSIFQCLCMGQSKRSLVSQGIKADWRIFSNGEKEKLQDFAKNFSNWCKEHRPQVKNLTDINPIVTKEFLQHKANFCEQTTLNTYRTNFIKLERVISYAKNLDVKLVDYKKAPLSLTRLKDGVIPTKEELNEVKRSIPMDPKHLEKVMQNTRECNSKNAVQFAKLFGLRVAEPTVVTKGMVNFKEGTVTIKGKHNKTRVLDIETKAQRQFLKGLTDSVKGDRDRLIPVQPNSVNKWLKDNLEKQGITKYTEHKTGVHSIRKMAAQEKWDNYRGKHTIAQAKEHFGWDKTKYEAITKDKDLKGLDEKERQILKDYLEKHTWEQTREHVSTYLGHGKQRDDVIEAYVKNAW